MRGQTLKSTQEAYAAQHIVDSGRTIVFRDVSTVQNCASKIVDIELHVDIPQRAAPKSINERTASISTPYDFYSRSFHYVIYAQNAH